MYLSIKIQMLDYSNILYLNKKRLLNYLKKIFYKLLFLKKFQIIYQYLTSIL